MNAREEMKTVRNWLRRQVKLINNDPYLKDCHGRIEARIVRWDARSHSMLVKVQDKARPETPYSCGSTRWLWVSVWSIFWKSNIWREMNHIVNQIRCNQD